MCCLPNNHIYLFRTIDRQQLAKKYCQLDFMDAYNKIKPQIIKNNSATHTLIFL